MSHLFTFGVVCASIVMLLLKPRNNNQKQFFSPTPNTETERVGSGFNSQSGTCFIENIVNPATFFIDRGMPIAIAIRGNVAQFIPRKMATRLRAEARKFILNDTRPGSGPCQVFNLRNFPQYTE
jgi:hypothetical protein